MGAPIIFTLQTDIGRFEAATQAKAALLEAMLVEKVNALDALLQQTIVRKLSGEVLNVITGKLVRSVEMIPATISGDVIEGGVQAGGGLAFYGKFQELGTSGPYEIMASKAKALAFMVGGKQVFARHVTHPGLPARSFVGSSVQELGPRIIAELQAVPSQLPK